MEKHAQNQAEITLGNLVVNQTYKTYSHFFPDLFDNLDQIPDPRERKAYSLSELIFSGVTMFMLQLGSRNSYNTYRKDDHFKNNYERLFGIDLPHMDTVNDVFIEMDESGLEQAIKKMITKLLKNKVLEKYKFRGKYIVAVDATKVVGFDSPHCDCCMRQTFNKGKKNEKTHYFHNVLEAKLITSNGFCLSLCSEWINNEGKNEFDKQDCEREAFKRLAKKLKKLYPRLPVIILADGLYPYKGFFDICKEKKWDYIVTLKDNSLKSLQQEIDWEKRYYKAQKTTVHTIVKKNRISSVYHWLTELEYENHSLNWVECQEERINTKEDQYDQRFVHLTNMDIDGDLCVGLSHAGRLRQKIENEGFNIQKNHGYALEHKYERSNFQALKNYYLCLQIAHIINQLTQKTDEITCLFKKDDKLSVKYLWERMRGFLTEGTVMECAISELISKRFQIRLQ